MRSFAFGQRAAILDTNVARVLHRVFVVNGDAKLLADFCATFQEALIDQLFDRLEVIWSRLDQPKPTEVAVAGGVAANTAVRERLSVWASQRAVIVRLPEKRFCTDNAAMIAFAALQKPADATDPRRVSARSRVQ